ncbi:unnamed protein product [Phytophthora fragariaefolia]|uniref:Unnamed protein product n=1 Tax=Phytophthora fragariaefolia TaxID=1490495 RepID=A0A9W7CZA2_9STRA|nr:unnamed protein product [Phytophthora fragariaefolia]
MFRVQSADGPDAVAATMPQQEHPPICPQKLHVSFEPSAVTAEAAIHQSSLPAAVADLSTDEFRPLPPPPDEDVEMNEEVDEDKCATMSSFDALQLLRDSSFDTVSRTAIIALMKIVTNILSEPENEKIRSIRLSNAAFHRSVGKIRGGLEFLHSLGFALVPETQKIVLNSSPRDKILLEEGLRLLNVEADDLNISPDTRSAVRENKTDPSFDVFKTQITRVQISHHHAIAVMQSSFHPNETIQDVKDHVTECLGDQYKENTFYLYTTPPTQKLAPTKTLAELSLVPAALMYLSWLEMPPSAEVPTIGFYFRQDLLVDESAEPKESLDPLQKTEYPRPLPLGENHLSRRDRRRRVHQQNPVRSRHGSSSSSQSAAPCLSGKNPPSGGTLKT